MVQAKEKLLQPSKIRMSKTKIYIYLTVGAMLSAFGTFYFLVYVQIMSAGLAGIAGGLAYTINDLILGGYALTNPDRATMDTVLYWVIYFIGNIPIIYLSTRWFSRRFLVHSVYFLTVNLAVSMVLANVDALNNPIVNVDPSTQPELYGLMTFMYGIFAGAIYGMGTGMAFKVGACAMGLDPVSKYISREKDLSIAPLLFGITITNTTIWTIVRYWTSGQYNQPDANFLHDTLLSARYIASWMFVLTYSTTVGRIYSPNKKVQIFVNSKKAEDISSYFNSINYHRGHTLFSVEGGYTKQQAKSVLMIVNIQEMYDVIEKIAAVDSRAFITVQEMLKVYDIREWKAMTDEDKEKEQIRLAKEQKRKDRLAEKRANKDA